MWEEKFRFLWAFQSSQLQVLALFSRAGPIYVFLIKKTNILNCWGVCARACVRAHTYLCVHYCAIMRLLGFKYKKELGSAAMGKIHKGPTWGRSFLSMYGNTQFYIWCMEVQCTLCLEWNWHLSVQSRLLYKSFPRNCLDQLQHWVLSVVHNCLKLAASVLATGHELCHPISPPANFNSIQLPQATLMFIILSSILTI